MSSKSKKATNFVVKFWNEDGSEMLNEVAYPMHIFSLNDVMEMLQGKEESCDIYECRYNKDRNQYVTVGDTYIWDACGWALQM